MYDLATFCYVCMSNKNSLKYFSSLDNDKMIILNFLFKAVWLFESNMYICEICADDLQKTSEFMDKCRKSCNLLKTYREQLQQNDSCSKLPVQLYINMPDFRESDFDEKCNTNIHSTTENIIYQTEEFTSNINLEVDVKKESNFDENTDNITEYPEFNNNSIENFNCKIEEFNMNSEIDLKKEELVMITSEINVDTEYMHIFSRPNNNYTNMEAEPNFQEDDCSSNSDLKIEKPETDMTEELDNLTSNIDVVPNLIVKNNEKARSCKLIAKKHDYKMSSKCSLCEKTGNNKRNLHQHIQAHKDRKRYKCTLCGKEYVRERNLNEHMMNHNDKLPEKSAH